MTPSAYQKVVDVIWKLAEAQGLRGVNAACIAETADVSFIEIRSLFPDQGSILLLLISDILAKIQALPNHSLSEQDYLFDTMMQGFDQAEPYKPAIQKIWSELKWQPWLLLPLLPAFQNKLAEIAASLTKKAGVLQPVFTGFALRTIFINVFLVWIEDETLDLSKTMSTLDQSLKQYEELNKYFI